MAELPSITDRFPPLPLQELVEIIGGFHAFTDAERSLAIAQLVETHAVVAYDWNGDWRYRRARVLGSSTEVSNIDGLIWRKDVVPAIGRANPPGFAVLYLADRVDTALAEVRADEVSVVLSEYVIRQDCQVHVAPIGEWIHLHRTGRGFLSGEASETMNGCLNACIPEEARALLLTDAFLYQCLTNTEDDYSLSSLVAASVFQKLPQVNVVAYPSTRQLGGICFAAKTDGFWESWGLVSARQANAQHLALGIYELSNVRHANGIDGSGGIRWDESVDDGPASVKQLDPPWYPMDS